ncbi:MAG: aminoglycoside phosphotransferase family protein, partial [Actinobacteria bacterium]|nr:aminoglycoside phosphotransferase family protein [Actinomycetota bacterium]
GMTVPGRKNLSIVTREHDGTVEVLTVDGAGGVSLPSHYQSEPSRIHAELGRRFGVEVATLECFEHGRPSRGAPRVFVHELLRSPGIGACDVRWVRPPAGPGLPPIVPEHREVLMAWFAASHRAVGEQSLPWRRRGWFAEAVTWSVDRLRASGIEVTGPVEQLGIRAWSAQLRIPTKVGVVYFKASPSFFGHEPELTHALSEWFPEHLPEVLAVCPGRHWMLTADFGPVPRLVDPAEVLAAYLAVAPCLAAIQRHAAQRCDFLLGVGCPDHRLGTLPALFEQLVEDASSVELAGDRHLTVDERGQLRSLAAELTETCTALAQLGVPESICHLDIWRGNFCFRDGRPFVFDWAESAVAQPFVSLQLMLRDVRMAAPGDCDAERRVRDAYLTEWAGHSGRNQLVEAADRSADLATVSQALLLRDALAALEPHRRRPYQGAIADQLKDLIHRHD